MDEGWGIANRGKDSKRCVILIWFPLSSSLW